MVLDESDRMAALVGSLLELSRMEEGGALHREVLAMDAWCGRSLTGWPSHWSERGST